MTDSHQSPMGALELSASNASTERRAPRSALDRDNMAAAIRALPRQLRDAWRSVGELELPASHRRPSAVLVAGMGGSAIGADLVASSFASRLDVPMTVLRHYDVPAWLGPGCLFVASSFSGNTEETLSAWDQAGQRGAARVAVTTGGQLADQARAAGEPLVPLAPGGAPRAALGRSVAATLGILRAAALIEPPNEQLEEAVTAMQVLVDRDVTEAETTPPAGSPRAVALHVAHRLAFVYVAQDLAPVARRWKAQLNENAKATAVADALPELNHNTVVGYGHPADLAARAAVVLLTCRGDHPRIQRRAELTAHLLERAGIPAHQVSSPAPLAAAGRFAETMWLCQFGDLVSLHVSALHGEDPTPIRDLDWLKAQLSSAPS